MYGFQLVTDALMIQSPVECITFRILDATQRNNESHVRCANTSNEASNKKQLPEVRAKAQAAVKDTGALRIYLCTNGAHLHVAWQCLSAPVGSGQSNVLSCLGFEHFSSSAPWAFRKHLEESFHWRSLSSGTVPLSLLQSR